MSLILFVLLMSNQKEWQVTPPVLWLLAALKKAGQSQKCEKTRAIFDWEMSDEYRCISKQYKTWECLRTLSQRSCERLVIILEYNTHPVVNPLYCFDKKWD